MIKLCQALLEGVILFSVFIFNLGGKLVDSGEYINIDIVAAEALVWRHY